MIERVVVQGIAGMTSSPGECLTIMFCFKRSKLLSNGSNHSR